MKTLVKKDIEGIISKLDEYERVISLSCFTSNELIDELKNRILINEDAKEYIKNSLILVDNIK